MITRRVARWDELTNLATNYTTSSNNAIILVLRLGP